MILGGGLVVMGVLFLPTLSTLPGLWSLSGGYPYGWPVLAFAVVLMWQGREQLLPRGGGDLAAAGLVSACSLFWLLGLTLALPTLEVLALTGVLVAWSAYVLGRTAGRHLAPIGSLAFLVVPAWRRCAPPCKPQLRL